MEKGVRRRRVWRKSAWRMESLEDESSGKRSSPDHDCAEGESGCVKTTVVCALLELFLRRKLEVRAFKCGPDYIDPMFHRQVLGIPSYNLDSFFCDENTVRFLLGRHGSPIQGKKGFWEPDFDLKEEQAKNSRESIAILEGVMGY